MEYNLQNFDIHIWSVDLSQNTELSVVDCLAPEERARADRFVFPKDRERFVIAHVALRNILANYLKITPEAAHYQYGEHGKPSLLTPNSPLLFNMSHAHERAMIAISKDVEVGIDIEYKKKDHSILALAKRFFSPEEYQVLSELPENSQLAAFYRCWTLKEAYLKMTGLGMSLPLSHFTVDFLGSDLNCLKSVKQGLMSLPTGSLGCLEVSGDYEAAVAAAEKIHSIIRFDY